MTDFQVSRDMMIGYSLGTGKMFARSFGDIQEAMEAIMGEPIWTHELASKERNKQITDEFERKALEQIAHETTHASEND